MTPVESAAQALAGPRLTTCSEPYWHAYARGYEDGCRRGYELHRGETEAAEAERWDDLSRRARAMASEPSFLELSRRRADVHAVARAEAQRRVLGLTA